MPGQFCHGTELPSRVNNRFHCQNAGTFPAMRRASEPWSDSMSLFGAMNTAISGLTAQSNAFSNISDNVANSQTVGYKRVDTNFIDYLTTSNCDRRTIPVLWSPRPDYVNNVQGHCHADRQSPGTRHRRPGLLRGVAADGEVEQHPDLQPAAVLHARRRLPDGQERLPGEQRGRVSQRLAGRCRHRHGEPEHAGADPGDADRLQSGAHHHGDIVGQPAGHPGIGTATPTSPISSDIDVYDCARHDAHHHTELGEDRAGCMVGAGKFPRRQDCRGPRRCHGRGSWDC